MNVPLEELSGHLHQLYAELSRSASRPFQKSGDLGVAGSVSVGTTTTSPAVPGAF